MAFHRVLGWVYYCSKFQRQQPKLKHLFYVVYRIQFSKYVWSTSYVAAVLCHQLCYVHVLKSGLNYTVRYARFVRQILI